jgi:hypothetical protein
LNITASLLLCVFFGLAIASPPYGYYTITNAQSHAQTESTFYFMSDNNKRRVIIFYHFMFFKLLLLCMGIQHSSMSDNFKPPACPIGTTLAKVA